MEIKGILLKKLDLETGISKAGKEWEKQSIVLDIGGDFNNEVCISAFGDKVKQIRDKEIGMHLTILCNVYSREFKGKYYNSIDGYHFTNTSNKPEEISGRALNVHFEGTTPEDLPF